MKIATFHNQNPEEFARVLKGFIENKNYDILEKILYGTAIPTQQQIQGVGPAFGAVCIHCATIIFEDNTPDEIKED